MNSINFMPFYITTLSLLLSLTLFGCSLEKQGKSVLEPVEAINNVPDHNGAAYFSDNRANHFTRDLLFMKEPSVRASLPKGATFVIRFTLFSSFRDNYSVRLFDKNGIIAARGVRVTKDESFKSFKIAEDKNGVIARDLSGPIKDLINNSMFWKPLTENEQGLNGLDGDTWIFELRDERGYYMIDIWSPEQKRPSDEKFKNAGFDPAEIRDFRPYVKAGDYFLKLLNFKRESFFK